MMIFAALLVLCLAVDSSFAQSTCENPISCPCGSTGKNITICIQTDDEKPCENISRCKSCEDGLNNCLECPEGWKGPFCSIKTSQEKSRQKRQYSSYPVRNTQYGGYSPNQYQQNGNCANLESPKLGSIRCVSRGQERTCTGRCLPGYSFQNYQSDEVVLSCVRGVWTPQNVFPDCVSGGHCDLVVQGAGSFNCTTGMEGTRCDVICNNRYIGRYFCYPGREWNPPLPGCVRPKEVVENRHPCPCEYGGSCDGDGHCICPVGRTGRYCEAIVPDIHVCHDPGFITNGYRRNTDGSESTNHHLYEEGESVVFVCESDRFDLRGSSIVTCTHHGVWSSSLPRCVLHAAHSDDNLRFCRDPGVDPNGSRQPRSPSNRRGFPQGSRLEYSCNPGYDLIGERSIFCMTSGGWSASVPTCESQSPNPDTSEESQVAYCLNPGSLSNGRVVYYPDFGTARRGTPQPEELDDPEYPEGSRLQYSCDSGYSIQGRASLTCGSSGSWSSEPPVCKKKTADSVRLRSCRNPGTISNGRFDYYSNPNERRPRPPDVFDAIEEEYPQGSRLEYSCNNGYNLQGSASSVCQATGFWSTNRPTCVRVKNVERLKCDNPGPILNGRARYFSAGTRRGQGSPAREDWDEYPEGTRLEYSCDDGYLLQGSYAITCQSTGIWSSDAPTCIGECGRSVMQTSIRILNGSKTVSGEWPWVVAISVEENGDTRLICGGAVLNSQTVITAAHCLVEARTFTLRFGKLHRRIRDDDAEVLVRTTNRRIIHSDFNNSTFDSDIGLLIFQPRIRYSIRVQPICLPSAESTTRNLMTGRTGYVAGWGITEKNLQADELMLASLPVLNNEACVESYKKQNIELSVTRNMFCAGFENAEQSTCSGDSGSPLVFYDRSSERFTLEGLVSFGVEGQCGLRGRHTIFTRVFHFLPWIYRSMQ